MRNRTGLMWLVALTLYATGVAAEPDTLGRGAMRDGEPLVLNPGAVIVRQSTQGILVSSVREFASPDTIIAISPPNPTYEITATFTFAGAGAGGRYWCREYLGPAGVFQDCGSAGSGGWGDQGSKTFTGLMPGIHIFEVYAEDRNGGKDSTPAMFIWEIKDTVIVSAPSNPNNQTTAVFVFTGAGAGGKYLCREYIGTAGAFQDCGAAGSGGSGDTGTKSFSSLASGAHTFEVYAQSAVGTMDASPAKFLWEVDSTPPNPPVVVLPTEGTCTNSNSSVTVEGSTEAGAAVTVFLDGLFDTARTATADGLGRWTMGFPLGELNDGPHAFTAKARDLAGNISNLSNRRNFIRDRDPPETWIVEKPPVVSSSSRAVFKFGSDESGVRFMCDRNDGKWRFDCSNGLELVGLLDGPQALAVAAVDCAGNEDPTPEVYQWTVDTTSPDVRMTSPREDEVVGTKSPVISGTSALASTVHVIIAGNDSQTPLVMGDTPVGANGTWSFAVPVFLVDGYYTATAIATDLAGNSGPPFGPVHFTVDTMPPDTTILVAPPAVDHRGSAQFVFQSSNGGSLFECILDKVPVQDSDWTRITNQYRTPPLKDGEHFLLVRAVDDVGNKDPEPARYEWEVAAERPSPPEIIDPQEGAVVSSLTPTIQGKGVPQGTVELFLDMSEISEDSLPFAKPVVDVNGNWAFTFTSRLEEGPHSLMGRAVNKLQNRSALSSRITFTVAAPVPTPPEEEQGCAVSSSSASPWLVVLGLLAVLAGRARRQRSR
ncbi:Ig-like domain-containing protein [Hyalangium versicolor]|uniref:Ig-like domain-containing protein n=1 Tax=Hyalangium versicolor TaxID=2861190 RepID=UPI001CCAFE10|nr:Ig-like domain-containing protein [Hyalangium versicolor]